jgi:hypothetical protein
MTKATAWRTGPLAVLLLALLVGCGTPRPGGTPGPGGGAAGPAAAGTPASPATAIWGSYGPDATQVTSMSTVDSGRVLAVAVQVPSGGDGCMRDLTGGLTDFNATMAYLTVTFQSRASSVPGGCRSQRVVTVRIHLPAPLGRRDVMINSDTLTIFGPGHGTLLRRCGQAGCGPFPPLPPASCTTPSYQQAMLSTGPAADPSYQALGCDGRWLVLDVGWPGGAAGCDGPSCSPDMVSTRWFFQASPHGWVSITTAMTGGCTQVHKADPRFPARLCATLPAP